MKKGFINIALFFSLVGTFSSCSKKMEDTYQNPEMITEASLGKLLSGMYLNRRIHPSYWDYYTFIMPTMSLYTQAVATPPSTQMYVPNLSYGENRWTDFYTGSRPNGSDNPDYNYNGPGIMSNFREMQLAYGSMSEVQKRNNAVYLKLAEILVADQAAQMIDLWGDIPYFKAGSLNTDRVVTKAPFDDAAAVYDTLIAHLKDINAYLDTATVANEVKADLQKQDIVLKGSIEKWQRYANSLRLRLLMRISNVKESVAQAEITTMLNNPATYPVIDDNSQNVILNESPTALRSDLQDVFQDYSYAPQYLIEDVMAANNDPRTEVFWDADDVNGFAGFPYDGLTSDYENSQRLYAVYDTATFLYNNNLPGVIFTAAEVSFIKAEAAERWGVGTAQTEYEKGITQSIAFYYGLNQSAIKKDGPSFTRAALASPTAAAIAAYLAMPAIAYTGTTAEKLEKIGIQKWEHFFVLQAGQSWAEVRRTGYPVLNYATAPGSANPQPPTRLLYPSTEQLYNSDNYSKVASKDTRNTKVFWQK